MGEDEGADVAEPVLVIGQAGGCGGFVFVIAVDGKVEQSGDAPADLRECRRGDGLRARVEERERTGFEVEAETLGPPA